MKKIFDWMWEWIPGILAYSFAVAIIPGLLWLISGVFLQVFQQFFDWLNSNRLGWAYYPLCVIIGTVIFIRRNQKV